MIPVVGFFVSPSSEICLSSLSKASDGLDSFSEMVGRLRPDPLGLREDDSREAEESLETRESDDALGEWPAR